MLITNKVVTIEHVLDPYDTNESGPSTGDVTDIVFTAPSTITSTTTNLSVFRDGFKIKVDGSTLNSGTYTVSGTPTTGSLTIVETSLSTESGETVSIEHTYNIITTKTVVES